MSHQESAPPDSLSKHVYVLLASFSKAVSDEMIESYLDALDDLTEKEIESSFREAKRRVQTGFAPTPGEIMAIVEEMRENEVPAHRTVCKECRGTGFVIKTVMDPNDTRKEKHRAAVICDCVSVERRDAYEERLTAQKRHLSGDDTVHVP
jgi:hypothetical protein